MMTDTPTLPALVGLGPGPTTGLRLVLGDHRLVGRSVDCDLRLTEDQVGARHAVLSRHDGRTWVQDLGTPGGTFVNGQRLGGSAHPLRRGDVVVFGTVALRVAAEPDQHRAAATPPADQPADQPAGEPRYGWPSGPPEALLGEIETLRVRARRLIGCGTGAFLLGFALFAVAALGLAADTGLDRVSQPLGRIVLGVPAGLLGWGISAVGMVALVAGFALHSVASTRRRQVERELPWIRRQR
jgi:hypothetical protein